MPWFLLWRSFTLSIRYAVAYVLGSFRDSPAPRCAVGFGGGALKITRPTMRSQRSGPSQTVSPRFWPPIWRRSRGTHDPTKTSAWWWAQGATHQCQRSVASPVWGKAEISIPHSFVWRKRGFWGIEVLRERLARRARPTGLRFCAEWDVRLTTDDLRGRHYD